MTHRIISLDTEDICLSSDLDDSRGMYIFWGELGALIKKVTAEELPPEGIAFCVRVKPDDNGVVAKT